MSALSLATRVWSYSTDIAAAAHLRLPHHLRNAFRFRYFRNFGKLTDAWLALCTVQAPSQQRGPAEWRLSWNTPSTGQS